MNKRFLIILVALLIALRWIFPESDPAWWFNIEDLHDEAWWAENARRKIIFNEWMWDEYAGALASGPLAAVWHWITFKLFGISFFSLRLVSLIPATLMLILLWFRNTLSNNENKVGFFLLASSPAFFSLNRVGYLEMMLILILLLSITLIQKRKIWASVFSGILFCSGLLFKGSFIFLLVPLLIWLWLDSSNRKHLLISTSVLAILSLISLLIYFIPNRALFAPYVNAFSQDYILANVLYDPRGWIARLAWLPEKSWISSPLACWLGIYTLIKISKGYIPSFKSSVWGLFILVILFALFTDFSDRRLSVLIILLPFIILEDFKIETQTFQNIFIGFILSLSLIPWIIGHIPKGSYDLLLNESGKFGLMLLALNIVGYLFLKVLNIQKPSIYILRTGIACWILAVMHYSAVNIAALLDINYWLLMVVQSFLSLLILNYEYQFVKMRLTNATLAKSLIGAQILILLSVVLLPSYTLLKTAQHVSKIVRPEERITGPNNAIELCFLSKGKTYMYASKSNTDDRIFVGYYSNFNHNSSVVNENNTIFKPQIGQRFSLFPLPKKHKTEAIIIY